MPFQRVFRCVSVGSCAPLRVFSRLEAVIKIGIVVMDPKSYLALVEDRDTPLLLQALHRAGVSAEAFSWHDREVDWSQRSEEHTSELQSRGQLVCRLLLEIKETKPT